jgi:hypothetical protein
VGAGGVGVGNILKLWRLMTVVLVALLTGLAFAHVLEKPAKMTYEGPLYVTLQRTLYVAWGPPNVGGMLEPAAIMAAVALAIMERKRPRRFALIVGAVFALLLAFPVVFFWLVAPANEAFGSTMPGSAPANWRDLRDQWELGHTIRFALQLLSLGLIVSSAVFSEQPGSNTPEQVDA